MDASLSVLGPLTLIVDSESIVLRPAQRRVAATITCLGGGEVPAGMPIRVPEGGQVVSSIEKGNTFVVVLQYAVGRYGGILTFYEDWVAGQAMDSLTETGSTNPRSDGWMGEIGDASFGIALLEGLDDSSDSVVSAILNWEA